MTGVMNVDVKYGDLFTAFENSLYLGKSLSISLFFTRNEVKG